jgi:spore coat protein U-like protein
MKVGNLLPTYNLPPFNRFITEKKMFTKKVSAIFTTAAIISISSSAIAATSTAALNVTATVAASCAISTSPVSFGTYNPANGTATTSSGSVTISCVKGSDPIVSLDMGQNPIGGFRTMIDPVAASAENLSYQLYKPASLTPNTACSGTETVGWGSIGNDRLDLPVSTSIAAQTYNICGSIPAGQDVATGSYQDVVTASVDF